MPRSSAAGVASENPEEAIAAPVTLAQAKVAQESARISLIDQMRDYFAAQPRTRVKVRNDGDVFVQVNGYTFVIQANVPVDVPVDVAKLLEDADYI